MKSAPPTPTLGAFHLDAPIARGGMGEVWRAHHRSGARVAVKVLTAEASTRELWAESLHAEIRAVAGLDHPHIVWIQDAGVVSRREAEGSGGRLMAGGPWFAMELADGGTLRERTLTGWDEARAVLVAMLKALAHAHARGIVHRDIKPANVLFADGVPKLSDFGMVFSTDQALEPSPVGGGTPAYMAPEQFEGERWDLGPWTDLYALGCLAYSMVVGRRPFPGSGWVRLFHAHWHAPIPEVEPRFPIPPGFEDWLHAMMAKNRHHRYQRAADALHALHALEEPTTAGAPKTRGMPAPTMGGTTGSRRPIYPRPPLPHFRERLAGPRDNAVVGLGLYGLRTLPFVGRNRERARLWESLAAVMRDRRPRAVVLSGPAGVGKSRLAEWLLQRTHEVGAATTFRATHAPMPAPLDGLAGLLARPLRAWSREPDTLARALRDELGPRGLRDPGVHAALSQLILPSGDGPDLGGGRRHALVHRAIAALANERVAVIWLDDVQWGVDAIDFAQRVLDAERGQPTLLVLTARSDLLAGEAQADAALQQLLAHERATQVPLDVLGRRASVELVERGLGLHPELAQRLYDRFHGNPMLAVELVGDWIERGLLVPGVEGFTLADRRALRTPDNVEAVWRRRLEQLVTAEPALERPLAVAAVLGIEVDPTEWQRACEHAGVPVPADFWGRAQRLRLVRRDPSVDRYAFMHGTLRDAVLARATSDGDVRALHRAAAAVVTDAAQQGNHLLRAGDVQRGVTLLFEAAEQASTTDMRAALKLLLLRDEALARIDPQHPGRIDGWLLASRVTRAAGKPTEGLDWGERALSLARHHRDRDAIVRALVCICSASRMMGRMEQARSTIEAALHLSDGLDPRLRANTLFECAALLMQRGDVAGAERTIRRSMQLQQDPASRIRSGALLGYLQSQLGRMREARRTLTDLLPVAEGVDDKQGLADVHVSLGEVERACGREGTAEAHYRRALEVLAGTGIDAPACRANLALTLLGRGDIDEARQLFEQVRAEAGEIGVRLLTLLADAGLAACAADQRRWSAMERHLKLLARDPGGIAADDIARCLHHAGTHALAMEQDRLGRTAIRLAAAQLDQLGRIDEANDLRELLGLG